MIKIENWSCVATQDPYIPPEATCIHLKGNVYNHSSFEDGDLVVTSPIKDAKGLQVTTESGRVYLLGNVSSNYREWLNRNRPKWDENNPITILKH